MKQFDYEGVDRKGRTISGTTSAADKEEAKARLEKFKLREVHIKERGASKRQIDQPRHIEEPPPDDLIQKLVDGDIAVEETIGEEEADGDEWRRLEVLARVRNYRRKENITVVVTLIVFGVLAAYFMYDKATEVKAPQPKIITRSSNEMLTFKDVYVKGQDLIFVVYARNWNGNVRVDFKAWDPFENVAGFGTARLGFIGDHYGGSPEKSGTFKLKKTRYYETIEIRVSGDEGR